MGNVSNHDVLHSHPVLPAGTERHLACDQHGESSLERYHPRAIRNAPEPMGTGVKGQRVLPAFVWIRRGLPQLPQGVEKGSSGQEGARWLVSQPHWLRTLLEEGVRGVGGHLPLTHTPLVTRPALRTGGGPSPAQADKAVS